MRKYVIIIFLLIPFIQGFSQKNNVLRLSEGDVQSVFLKQNLSLIAEKMNVDAANAAIVQAKLWDNPNFSLNSISFWSTKAQRGGQDVAIPPIAGNFGKNMEFCAEIDQVIRTAGKRSKQVGMTQVSKEMAIKNFGEVLRNLKLELMTAVYELEYLQSYTKVIFNQEKSVSELISAYNDQVKKKNIPLNDLMRLQSEYLELQNEANTTKASYNEQQKIIKDMLNADPTSTIEIVPTGKNLVDPHDINLGNLIDSADYRPDIEKQKLQTEYYKRSLTYERAQRIPDFTLSANYDRMGSTWRDFLGIGISFELPVFNRNQGNIRAANINQLQSQYIERQMKNTAANEIAESFGNYMNAYDFYKKLKDNKLFEQLDPMMQTYKQNMMMRNISMLEFTDFMDTYKNNQQTILESYKNAKQLLEQLEYSVGKEIK